MRVAAGTTRKPKIDAIKQTFSLLSERYPEFSRIYLDKYEVDSGVSETPSNLSELILGAKNRVMRMIEDGVTADFYIGMEGGIFPRSIDEEEYSFLQSWVYVSNGSLGYFGASQVLQIPGEIDNQIRVGKRSLAEVIDEFSGKTNVRDSDGTFGILTDNIVTRTGAFIQALLSAFAPFYVKKYRW